MTYEAKTRMEGLPNRQDWVPGDFINASDYEYIIKHNHLIFTRPFRRTPGWDISYATTSGTLTQINSSGATDLSEWTGMSRPIRYISPQQNSEADGIAIGVAAYLKQLNIRITAYVLYWDTSTQTKTRTQLGTIDVGHSGSSLSAVRNGEFFSLPDVQDENENPAILEYDIQAIATSGTGEMELWAVDDGVISTTYMP